MPARLSHALFTDAEFLEDDVQNVVHVDCAGNAGEGAGGEANIFPHQFGRFVMTHRVKGALQMMLAVGERVAVARAGDGRGVLMLQDVLEAMFYRVD